LNFPFSLKELRRLKKATAQSSHNLDLLRAIAVLSVYVAHFSRTIGFYDPGSLGRFGVIIFFVHTSCVLMASLQRLQSTGFHAPGSLCWAFYARRFFRIYPLAILCIVLVYLLRIPAMPNLSYSPMGSRTLIGNLALSQNLFYLPDAIGPLWSLPLEVQMYIVLPFAYLLLRRYRFAPYFLWLLALVFALTIPQLSQRLNVFSFAPCFASGILAYSLFSETRRKLPAWIWPLVILVVTALFQPLDNISLSKKLPLAWVLALVLGVAFPFIQEIQWRPLNRLSHWIAEISYGIYLSHIPLMWFALKVMAPYPLALRLLVLLTGSAVIPMLLYRFIEKPMIGVGARLAARLLQTAPKSKASAIETMGISKASHLSGILLHGADSSAQGIGLETASSPQGRLTTRTYPQSRYIADAKRERSGKTFNELKKT
jgi:peptidoglycan/LPS O-acetylase OafA/YrhL